MMVQKSPSLLKIYSLLHSQNLFKTPPLPSLYGPVAQPGSSAALIRQRSAVQIRSGPFIFFLLIELTKKKSFFGCSETAVSDIFFAVPKGRRKKRSVRIRSGPFIFFLFDYKSQIYFIRLDFIWEIPYPLLQTILFSLMLFCIR